MMEKKKIEKVEFLAFQGDSFLAGEQRRRYLAYLKVSTLHDEDESS